MDSDAVYVPPATRLRLRPGVSFGALSYELRAMGAWRDAYSYAPAQGLTWEDLAKMADSIQERMLAEDVERALVRGKSE